MAANHPGSHYFDFCFPGIWGLPVLVLVVRSGDKGSGAVLVFNDLGEGNML